MDGFQFVQQGGAVHLITYCQMCLPLLTFQLCSIHSSVLYIDFTSKLTTQIVTNKVHSSGNIISTSARWTGASSPATPHGAAPPSTLNISSHK